MTSDRKSNFGVEFDFVDKAPNVYEKISEHEDKLGVPKGFFVKLFEEDDWSFVIKLHALFEAAANYILVRKLGVPEIEESINYLEFSGARIGKTKLLMEMGVISKRQFTFTNKLSALRNQLVHRISNVNFSFSEYIGDMDSNQRKEFVKTFGYGVLETIPLKSGPISRDQYAIDSPKNTIFISASDALACLLLEDDFIKLEEMKTVEKEKQLAMYQSLAKIIKSKKSS